MKTIHDILKLGDPRLYEVCAPVRREELDEVPGWIQQLHDAMEGEGASPPLSLES